MKIRNVISVIGILHITVGILLLVPFIISVISKDGESLAFLITTLISILSGVLFRIRRTDELVIEKKEAVCIVVFGWLSVSLIGSMPFYFSGYFNSFIDSFFESVSGFTTTGASILTDIESLPKSLLLWRSLTHWLGGMGIIIFALIVLPVINVGVKNLYMSESSVMAQEQITPKIKDTARILWFIYLLLTAAETILLLLGGLSLYDAILTSFGTIPTGGFSPRNGSIASYNSLYVEIVVMVFMVLSGINFSLYFSILRGGLKSVKTFEVIKFYLILMATAILIVVIDLRLHTYMDLGNALRYGAFQTISINTTTGFITADYAKWRPITQIVLLILMLIGACPGSTTGAIKNTRILLLGKSIYRELLQLINPRMVTSIQLNNRIVDDRIIRGVLVYVGMYLIFFFFASLLMVSTGIDIITAIYSVATNLGGVGPGLGLTGPMRNYALLSGFNKSVLIVCMLLGRLEFYSILLLLIPRFWRKV